ncbi:hypothetical protein KCU95_g8171, partial [Aureobasidium melanogenum]
MPPSKTRPSSQPQTYVQKPPVLKKKDASIKDYTKYLTEITTADRVATLHRTAADMWMVTIWHEIVAQLRKELNEEANPQVVKRVTQEIVLHALGHDFPKSFEGNVKEVDVTDERLEYTVKHANGDLTGKAE